MHKKRRTKRYQGYGFVTENLFEMIKSAGKKLLKQGAIYAGDKIGSKIANKLMPKPKQIVKNKSREEVLANLQKSLTEEDFGL